MLSADSAKARPRRTPRRGRRYLVFALDRPEAHHLLRALTRASAAATEHATPDERRKAESDADAYDAIRDRLLTEVARLDCATEPADDDPESDAA